MYIPAHFAASPDDVRALLTSHTAADLVTSTGTGLLASTLPLIFDPDAGEHGALRGHLARNNPQWSTPARGESLVILRGSDAYITPTWYAAKARHGRVVPTWNYAVVHAWGTPRVIEDAAWLADQIAALTHAHEAPRPEPWAVSDAPEAFVAAQIRGIIGVEIPIRRIEGKWKVSQNRPAADRTGVALGIQPEEPVMAALVDAYGAGRR